MGLAERIRKDYALSYALGYITTDQFNAIMTRTEGIQPMNHLVDDIKKILED